MKNVPQIVAHFYFKKVYEVSPAYPACYNRAMEENTYAKS